VEFFCGDERMKYNKKNKLTIAFTLDSSEAIMFHKGGLQKVNLSRDDLSDQYDEIEVTFQIKKEQMDRHNFVVGEAEKHLNNLTDEEIEARRKDKK
jgi:hypothetical protein